MKKLIISLFLLLSLLLGLNGLGSNQTNAESAKKSKPTVLYVYAPYCGACTQFAPLFESMKAKYSDKFNFEKEDSYTSKRAKTLNVRETPSVYILENDKVKQIEWKCLSRQGCFQERLEKY